MKKIIFGLAFLAYGFAANAQGFNIGMGGGIYSTWLVNKNVSDQGDFLDFAVTFGGQIGVNGSYYFSDKMGVGFGFFFTGHNQKYTGDLGPEASYEAKTKLRYLDVPIMIRFGGGKGGAYFEMGPQFGFLMSAKEQIEFTPSEPTIEYKDENVKDNLSGTNIAAVIGFGVDIDASESISVTTGLRLGYGFTDVTKKMTETEFESRAAMDELTGSHTLSFASSGAHIDDDGNFKYKSTSRAFGGLFLSVNYKIPTGGSKGTPVPETK